MHASSSRALNFLYTSEITAPFTAWPKTMAFFTALVSMWHEKLHSVHGGENIMNSIIALVVRFALK